MYKRRMAVKFVAVAVAFAAAFTRVSVPRVEAMMIPAHVTAAVSQTDRQADLAAVQSALESKIIRQRLADMKLSPAEINQRIAKLDDQKVHQLAMHIDKQNAAADGGATVLIVIAAIALLALIISLLKHDVHHDDHVEHHDDHTVETTAPAAAPAAPAADQRTIIVK